MKNKRQLGRFALVGGINTALDFGLLFVFKSIGIPLELSNIFSTSIAFVFSFVMNKKYTFKTSGNVVREMTLFVIVTLFGLWVLQTAIINWTHPLTLRILHDDTLAVLASKLLATVVSLTWNYILYDKLVFKKPTVDSHPEVE